MDMKLDYLTPDDLDCVYRVDKYDILDTTEKEYFSYQEIFMVCGDNSVLRVVDIETGLLYVQMYDKSFYYSISLSEVNDFRKALMVYDYCVSQLRKLTNKKEALNSKYFALKSCLELYIQEQNFNSDIDYFKFISDYEMHELEKRCKYLAHAYELEWNGVVSMETVRKFKSIPELNHYAFQRGLFKYGEGFDKRIEKSCVFKMDFDAIDILSPLRKVEDELGRVKGLDEMSDEQFLQHNAENATYIKADNEIQKLICKSEKLNDKLMRTKSKIKANMLGKQQKRVMDKITDELPYVVFIP